MKTITLNVLVALCISFTFLSCDRTQTSDIETNALTANDSILKIAYDIKYKYPADFYHDITPVNSIYYLNAEIIKPLSEGGNGWIELSTNDKNEALSWSNSSANNSSVHWQFISEKETEKYFEFKGQNQEIKTEILLFRVHKTSYFKPSENLAKQSDTLGIYNGILMADSVKELVEYLWNKKTYNLFGSKVLETHMTEYNSYYEQYIKSISFIGGDYGVNDQIEVYDNYFRLMKSTRILTQQSTKINTIKGHEN